MSLPILEALAPRRHVVSRLRMISTPGKLIDDKLRSLIVDMLEQRDDVLGIGLAV